MHLRNKLTHPLQYNYATKECWYSKNTNILFEISSQGYYIV